MENVSDEDIEMLVRGRDGVERTFTFEKGETVNGLAPKVVKRLALDYPNILCYVRLEPIWDEEEKVNWITEGF